MPSSCLVARFQWSYLGCYAINSNVIDGKIVSLWFVTTGLLFINWMKKLLLFHFFFNLYLLPVCFYCFHDNFIWQTEAFPSKYYVQKQPDRRRRFEIIMKIPSHLFLLLLFVVHSEIVRVFFICGSHWQLVASFRSISFNIPYWEERNYI